MPVTSINTDSLVGKEILQGRPGIPTVQVEKLGLRERGSPPKSIKLKNRACPRAMPLCLGLRSLHTLGTY